MGVIKGIIVDAKKTNVGIFKSGLEIKLSTNHGKKHVVIPESFPGIQEKRTHTIEEAKQNMQRLTKEIQQCQARQDVTTAKRLLTQFNSWKKKLNPSYADVLNGRRVRVKLLFE